EPVDFGKKIAVGDAEPVQFQSAVVVTLARNARGSDRADQSASIGQMGGGASECGLDIMFEHLGGRRGFALRGEWVGRRGDQRSKIEAGGSKSVFGFGRFRVELAISLENSGLLAYLADQIREVLREP